MWFLLLLALVYTVSGLFSKQGSSKEISWQLFRKELLPMGNIEKLVVVNNEKVEVYVNGKKYEESRYWFGIGSLESFEAKMNEAAVEIEGIKQIPIHYQRKNDWLPGVVSLIFPLMLLFLLWRAFSGRLSIPGAEGGQFFNFGKSNATLVEKERATVTFDDVAGLEEAELEVREIVDFLKAPEKFTRVGATIPKGIMLVGPPGTGKTLLAKAVAGEAGVPFFSISGSAFVEMFVGVGASRVRDLFKTAKEKTPCIVFIDEIDAIGRSRGRGAFSSGSNDERESTLNQLLTEMDGFETNSGVIVLAATNRADLLDPALLRPGRFDRHIYLELPNIREREEIFKVHIRRLVMDQDIDIHFLAAQTPGFSGADIANICNESALITARVGKDKISKQAFLEAIERMIGGLEKKSKIISPEEKNRIAYHEAGHAVASWLLSRVDPLVKVSIIPRGKALGSAWYLPEEKYILGEITFEERICANLAGRAAEDILLGELSSGALDDLEKVTKQAYTMVAYYGFNDKIGHVSFYDSTGRSENGLLKPYSEQTGKIIDDEVRMLVAACYQRTKDLLMSNKAMLLAIANLLNKKETLYKEDLEKILGKRKTPQKKVSHVESTVH